VRGSYISNQGKQMTIMIQKEKTETKQITMEYMVINTYCNLK